MAYSPLTKSGKMHFTEEQYQVAKRASALEIAKKLGYPMVRKGSDYVGADHDSEVFASNGGYHWNSQNIHGRAITFLQVRMGMSFPAAVLTLNGYDIHNLSQEASTPPKTPAYQPRKTEETKRPFTLPERAPKDNNIFWYLLRNRGLDREIVEQLVHNDLVYQTDYRSKDGRIRNNVVFVARDSQGNPRAAQMRGTGKATFHMSVEGSNKNFSFTLAGNQDSKTVYFFESPIDAISHASIQKLALQDWKDGHRVALSGNFPIEAVTRVLGENPQVENIVFCLDNDEAGRKMYDFARDSLAQLGIPAEKISFSGAPVGKDWNEYLQAWHTAEKEFEKAPTTHEDSVGGGKPAGRLHLLDAQGQISKSAVYYDQSRFQLAARYASQQKMPMVIEDYSKQAEKERSRRPDHAAQNQNKQNENQNKQNARSNQHYRKRNSQDASH